MAARQQQQSSQGTHRSTSAGAPDPDQENYYELLGVHYSATSAEITKSYREAMKRFHPDRVRPEYRAAAENLCKDLNRAYRTLSNPVERVAYDRSIKTQVVQDQIMQRYVGGFSGPASGGADPYAAKLRRTPSAAEKREHRQSERSALISLFSVFLVLTLGAIGLILIGGLVSFLWGEFFG